MKGKLFLIAAAGAILAGCAQVSGAAQASGAAQYQSLDTTIEPVKAAFNRDVNKTRLILLVSPTCGECLRGSSEIQDTVFAHETSPNLTAYVVWVPELGAKSENVPGGMALIPDKRANNYWDAQELLGRAYKTILPTPTAEHRRSRTIGCRSSRARPRRLASIPRSSRTMLTTYYLHAATRSQRRARREV